MLPFHSLGYSCPDSTKRLVSVPIFLAVLSPNLRGVRLQTLITLGEHRLGQISAIVNLFWGACQCKVNPAAPARPSSQGQPLNELFHSAISHHYQINVDATDTGKPVALIISSSTRRLVVKFHSPRLKDMALCPSGCLEKIRGRKENFDLSKMAGYAERWTVPISFSINTQ